MQDDLDKTSIPWRDIYSSEIVDCFIRMIKSRRRVLASHLSCNLSKLAVLCHCISKRRPR
jgi:hypothetical protein